MYIQNIEEYVRNVTIYKNTPFIINSKGAFYEYDGKLIPEDEFIKMFPIGEKIVRGNVNKGEIVGSVV